MGSSNIGLCRGCGRQDKLVRSHIIPNSLYEPVLQPDGFAVVRSVHPGKYPITTSTGIYEYMFCDSCERQFNDWDSYAADFFLRQMPSEPVSRFDKDLLAVVREVKELDLDYGNLGRRIFLKFDYVKLKLFFVSVLWRASLASHDFFSLVELGPHEARTRAMVQNRDPGTIDDYPAIISAFDDLEPTQVQISPSKQKLDHINGYRFFMAGCSVFIKVDRRPLPIQYGAYALNPNLPLIVPFMKWSVSAERLGILDAVNRTTESRRPVRR